MRMDGWQPRTQKGIAFAKRVEALRLERSRSRREASAKRRSEAAAARELVDPEFKALRDVWRARAQRRKDRAHRKRCSFAGARYTGVPPEQWEAIRSIHRTPHGRDVCAYCGREAKHTIDHLVPLSRGGEHSPRNVIPVCHWCNTSKGARLIWEWPKALRLLGHERYEDLSRRTQAMVDQS